MIWRWLSAHRSAVATTTSGTLVAALIATIAVVSGGYTAERLDLGDTAVWVTNQSRQVVGRANTSVQELNTVVTAGSSSLDVVQRGSTVLVVDQGSSSVGIMDPATAEVSDGVPLPPVEPAVYLGGNHAVIASGGDVWSLPADELPDFDSTSKPTLSLGTGSVSSMDDAGTYYSFSPATGDVSRVDTQAADTVSATVNLDAGAVDDDYQLTSVGAHWVLFNQTSGRLFTAGAEVDLSGAISDAGGAVLQVPSTTGDRVLVAHPGGLLSVALGGGTPKAVVAGRSGKPAAPATVGSCSFAAWSDGTAWRSCAGDGAEGTTTALAGVSGDAELVFRQNGAALLLNDALGGSAWAVQQDNQLIDNWDELIETEHDQQRVEENNDDTPPVFEKVQKPPVAVDDDFGARPGRAVILPVLLNDYDPNGDVLVISELSEPPRGQGALDLVGNNQQVQLTVAPAASGELSFEYTISDGRGGTASATVVVTIRADDENSPPVQVRTSQASAEVAGRVTTQVLGDWVDPDSDPFYLSGATTLAPDAVSFTADGTVIFTDAGTGAEQKQAVLVVSDGEAEGTGVLAVAVKPAGSVPIIAEPFVVLVTAGREVSVSPLGHVRGGAGAVRLSSVPAKPDVTLTPDFDGGTFRFSSTVVGTHYIDYSVTDGRLTASGLVRVDVVPAADANATPVTVPHTAFIRGQQAALVDVLATDFDPAGGVLLVTGTMNVPASSGLRVEILDQRTLRLTLTKPLESRSVTFNYRVSNGLAEAEGTVTVIEIPEPARKQAPVAVPDTISARVGDAIDIPVLANDEHPDGDALSLHPTLPGNIPAGGGLLFAAGNVLRYLAPDNAGDFTAVYQVDAPDGQFASATVRISVREADASSNNPPVPKTVTARVLAGQKVRIPIPLSGIDPDGDSVQLLGQETNPEKGSVVSVASDSIEYQSGEYSAGTDTFTYSVVDALGARAIGTVRVGISPRLDGARNPVAAPDEVTLRPGSTLSVRVLGNDSDPDGGTLTVTSVQSTSKNGIAEIDGDVVVVTAPVVPGRYGFIYEIKNDRGGTSSNFLTVVVKTDAPLSRPEARDTVLSLSEVLGRDSIDVDVLGQVFFADGPARSLRLSVLPGFGDQAQVTASKRIRVSIGDDSQIIPFAVGHPEDPSVVSYAFVWVPGYNDALPQLRKGLPGLGVASGSTLTIDINKYVLAVGGAKVRLTDESTVRATHSDGASLARDSGTLVFTSADKYFGPASISFEVTDGISATDPAGRKATIVLPINVTPRQNQPPTFDGAVIDFEPDQAKVIDLLKLTTYPYPDDQRELSFTVLEPKPVGFTWSQNGEQLTIRANESAPKGTVSSFTIGVRDGVSQGRAGRIELRVVASTRPLALPAADSQIAPRGQTTIVDVLANDNATNPFPAVPLRVIAVRGLDSGSLPAGIAITPSPDKSRLSVRVAADAAPLDTNLQYQVADATGDSDRYAWGTVRISVQDKPDSVANVRVTGFADRKLSVTFNPGAANNSPILGYEITLLNASTGAPLGTVPCPDTTCDLVTPGNGQANAVRVSVVARNSIGASSPVVTTTPVWSDVVPAAPTLLPAAPLDGGLRLSWKTVAPQGGATAVRGYVVTAGGQSQGEVSATGPSCSATTCTIDVPGVNGTDVPYSISARNDAYPALSSWNSAQGSGKPFGPARAGVVTASNTDATGSVTVDWDPFDGQGDAVAGYFVQRLNRNAVPTGAQACTVSAPAPGQVTAPRPGGSVDEQKTVTADGVTDNTQVTFTGLESSNATYSFVVWGYNRAGCAPTAVATVIVRPAPGPVAGVDGVMAMNGSSWDYKITDASGSFDHYQIRPAGDAGEGTRFSGAGWPSEAVGVTYGTAVSFELRGCTRWTCGPWSTFAAPEPSLTLAVSELQYDANSGTFAWTNGPNNGDLGLVATYRCFADSNPEKVGTATDPQTVCSIGGTPPAGQAQLVVTVDGHDFSYTKP